MPGWRVIAEAVGLAAWLGAVVLFAGVVAPALFAALPSRALAGAVVGRVLPVLLVTGIAIGGAVAASALLGGRDRGPAAAPGRAASAAVLALACLVTQTVIGGRIARLRAAIGPALDALAPDDPQRVAFGKLHAASVAGLGVGAVAAVVALVLAAAALRRG